MNSRKDLLISLGMLSIVVTFALIGLATDHNWPKMLRVSGAFPWDYALAWTHTLAAVTWED